MEDNSNILNQNRSWGPSGLILRKWVVDFNAYKEPHNVQKIWVILRGISMFFWKPNIFEAIGNRLWKFITLEDN